MFNVAEVQRNHVAAEGLLRRGELMSIYGPTRAISTWAASKLAGAAACGGLYLGKFKCHEGTVYVSDSAVSASDTLRRIRLLNPNIPLASSNKLWAMWHRNVRSFWRDVCSMTPASCHVLIVESFDRRFKQNPGQTLRLLRDHARRLDTAIVVVRHGTADSEADGLVDSVLRIKADGTGKLTVSTTTGSWFEAPMFEVNQD